MKNMNSKKLVSIIVPIYNSEKYLDKLLNNLIHQTYKNIEIILIDDGSIDNSLNICNKFKQSDHRIKVISKKNEGVSFARNKGIKVSSGDYVVFVDSDDNVNIDYIKTLLDNVIDKKCLVKCNYKKKLKIGLYNSGDFLEKIISGSILGSCWGYLFDREILRNIDFDINTSYMEDSIFIIKYLLRIKQVNVIKEELYCYNYNSESLTTSTNNIEKRIDGYLYSFNKIENVLKKHKIHNQIYTRYLNNRKIKIIESEISKLDNIESIEIIINKKNILDVVNIQKVPLKYMFFMILLKRKDYQNIVLYIKVRKIIKLILKGNRK